MIGNCEPLVDLQIKAKTLTFTNSTLHTVIFQSRSQKLHIFGQNRCLLLFVNVKTS